MESIQAKRNRLFCKLIQEIKLGIWDTNLDISSILFGLCFELCKLDTMEKEDLG